MTSRHHQSDRLSTKSLAPQGANERDTVAYTLQDVALGPDPCRAIGEFDPVRLGILFDAFFDELNWQTIGHRHGC